MTRDADTATVGQSAPRDATSVAAALVLEYLEERSRHAHEQLGDVAGVAVTMGVNGQPTTIGSSTQLALDVDLLQYDLGWGPCLMALKEGVGQYVPDLASDDRWGDYGPRAAQLGAASCISVPIVLGDDGPVAVLKVYASQVDGLTVEQRDLALAISREVAGGIGLATALAAGAVELDDRATVMNTRRPIDMAIGILMERHQNGHSAAFDRLRRYSQTHNVKLSLAAAQVVHSVSPEPIGDTAPFSKRGIHP